MKLVGLMKLWHRISLEDCFDRLRFGAANDGERSDKPLGLGVRPVGRLERLKTSKRWIVNCPVTL